ncbi:peroxiredoxin [Tannockella kyphosi]|uniref:peroxiredoxin n=1 Tax=Tannockella kyphosi TaxID=2899121 RepID=UPI002013B0A6|nr:peroxiredoxin [Tannockella kyphosi]
MLEIGSKAPDFTLYDREGKQHSLSDYLGKKVVVYFYPRDNTPGCTRQACAFKNSFQEYVNKGIEVIGISKDSQASHQKFTDKYELPFLLLSDPDLQAIQAYDVYKEKKLYGKTGLGVVRSTFVMDEQGMIIQIYAKAKPDTNATEILEMLG